MPLTYGGALDAEDHQSGSWTQVPLNIVHAAGDAANAYRVFATRCATFTAAEQLGCEYEVW